MSLKKTIDTLSVIIPVWGDRQLVHILYDRLVSVLANMPVNYRIIYVNDDCPFGSEFELHKLAQVDSNVTVISLSRNFGESIAVKAGIDFCDSDYAIIMDCDLQDRPEDIPLLYNKAKEGFDIVWGERVSREDNLFKKFFSSSFYFISNFISEQKINKKIGSFSCISKNVIIELKKINDYTFNYIQMVEYLGFKKTYVPIVKAHRKIGKSGYNIIKCLVLASKILVTTSVKPLLIPLFSCLFMFFIFVVALIYSAFFKQDFLFNKLFYLILFFVFVFCILFFNLSILSIYIGVILKENLTKPRYIIKSIKGKL